MTEIEEVEGAAAGILNDEAQVGLLQVHAQQPHDILNINCELFYYTDTSKIETGPYNERAR